MPVPGATAHRTYTFRCNICGKDNADVPARRLGRDESSCRRCRSSVRLRSVIHVLATELFGRCLPIAAFPCRPDLRGMGLSDARCYASRLRRRLDYVNTYYHRRPRFDITRAGDDDDAGTLDFLIATDVFEHVTPPIAHAFAGARRLLKPGGVFVFSVPYAIEGGTTEHFPDLHDYRIEKTCGKTILRNHTVDGREEVFENLIFHGGKGQVLELRLFALPDLRRCFADAGFAPPRIYGDDHAGCGMVWPHPWSLTMAARVPR